MWRPKQTWLLEGAAFGPTAARRAARRRGREALEAALRTHQVRRRARAVFEAAAQPPVQDEEQARSVPPLADEVQSEEELEDHLLG